MPDPLEVSIYQYLTSTKPNARIDRMAARTSLQKLVGDEIYLARRSRLPCGEESEYALTIRRLGRADYYDNWGEPDHAHAIIEFIALGTAQPTMVIQLIDYVRICCAGYSGTMGDNGEVCDAVVRRESMPRPQTPSDASDRWGYHHSMDIEFIYKQQQVQFGV